MKKQLCIEMEGDTVEDAIQKALHKLKLSRKNVRIQILSEEKKGLFGMPGAVPAKVRISVIPSKESS
jgi:spoIIIJ-associated protein